MGEEPPASMGLQISLRNMWIGLVVFGAYVGIMGRLFIYHPNVFFPVWGMTVTVVPFVLSIITLLVIAQNLPAQRKLRVWAAILGIVPVIGICSIPFFRYLQSQVGTEPSVASVSPSDYATIATDKLIKKYLPLRVQEPWVWDELENRLAQGDMTSEQVDAAMDVWLTELKKNGYRSLSWQRDFLVAIRKADLIKEEKLLALHDAFLEDPRVVTERLRLTDSSVKFDVDVDRLHESALPFDLVWDISEVRIDGEKVNYRVKHRNQYSLSGEIDRKLDKGSHRMEIGLKLGYASRDRLVGLNFQTLYFEKWPKTVKVWDKTLVTSYQVYENAKPVIKLVSEPKLDPVQFIDPVLVVQNDEDQKKLILETNIKNDVPVGCSFKCFVEVNGTEYELGSKYLVHTERSTRSSGGRKSVLIPSNNLPADVEIATVRLVPDPSLVFRMEGVKEIWGNDVVIPAVDLKRYDLETSD